MIVNFDPLEVGGLLILGLIYRVAMAYFDPQRLISPPATKLEMVKDLSNILVGYGLILIDKLDGRRDGRVGPIPIAEITRLTKEALDAKEEDSIDEEETKPTRRRRDVV
jgi:hypothetical protein